ncbi:MAG: DMT family transporter [Eubacteriales bacterium]|jgi:drug/metabolite transporter (DMT)-like permease
MSRHDQGIVFIVLAAFSFALMGFFVRMAGDIPTTQKMFFRNVVAVAIAFGALVRSGQGFRIQQGSLPLLLMRSTMGTLGILFNFYALDHMLLSDANMLGKLAPFFAIIMSTFLLKEKANRIEYGSVLIAMLGAMLVAKPTFGSEMIPALSAVLGAFTAGTAYTYVRLLGRNGERGPIIVLFFSVFSCLCALPFLIFDYHPMSWQQLGWLLLAGCAASGGQFSVTAAYTRAPAKDISVFDYSQILFSALLGMAFLDQFPDHWSLLGYLIIIGTAVGKWLYTRKHGEA